MPITSPIPPAPGRMGYIGKVTVFGTTIRSLSSSLTAKQDISHPDVVDNRIDRTLYQLGPVTVDGNVAFPVVKTSQSNAFLNFVWSIATVRDQSTGELVNSGNVVLAYSTGMSRTFRECRVKTLEMRATAGDRVEATLDFMGTIAVDGGESGDPIDLSPARVLMWDDVRVTPGGSVGFDTCVVREFNFTINNNLSRNYTFCDLSQNQGAPHSLFASNISTGKRHINGTLGFQGFAPTDASGAEVNSLKVTTNDTLSFDFGGFNKTFRHIIYEYQNIDINVGLITSTVNWYAHSGVSENAIDEG